LGANGRCRRCEAAAHVWTIQDWRPLLTLGLVIALGFSFTRLVVTAYDDRRQVLAAQYYAAGMQALDGHRAGEAVNALENALVYSNNNFEYQLKLTDALLDSGATDEALAQLHAFLDQRPGDAEVNLKLARLEARRNHADEAWGYYQAAIGGVWPGVSDPFPRRIAARFEAAEYLVGLPKQDAAEGALMELAEVLPESPVEQQKLGELFLRNGDAGRALKIFESEVQWYRVQRENLQRDRGGARGAGEQVGPEADQERYLAVMLGAARASFALGNFGGARRWLNELPAETAPGGERDKMLGQLQRMEGLDPFAEKTNAGVRAARTVAVFEIAMGRLAGCGVGFADAIKAGEGQAQTVGATGTRRDAPLRPQAQGGYAAGTAAPAAGAGQAQGGYAAGTAAPAAGARQAQAGAGPDAARWSGLQRWAEQIAPWMSERKLKGRDDVIESTMRFAFQAETMAQRDCGAPTADDEALLLLARERMGAGR
jgi:tetratricopeptide (TPR) repeat protein